MAVIQQVYFTKEEYSVYIKAIKPDEENPESGLIWINGNPTRLERKERYHIDSNLGMLITDSYQIPLVINPKRESKSDGRAGIINVNTENYLLQQRLLATILIKPDYPITENLQVDNYIKLFF